MKLDQTFFLFFFDDYIILIQNKFDVDLSYNFSNNLLNTMPSLPFKLVGAERNGTGTGTKHLPCYIICDLI